MKVWKIPQPDSDHLRDAGFLIRRRELTRAHEELEKITPARQTHPLVLLARWNLCAAEEKWDACLDIANAIVKEDPDLASGYTNRSKALRRVQSGGLQKAYDALLEAADRFPRNYTIHYALARYQAQLGDLDLAQTWLWKAFEIGEAWMLKPHALHDKDLKPLWNEIANFKVPWMPFHAVPVGAMFTFRGEWFTKVGLSVAESGDGTRNSLEHYHKVETEATARYFR